jgi:undecaprenyl diphosphate synthase
LVTTLNKEIRDLMQKNVRIMCIGNLDDLPAKTGDSMRKAIVDTRPNTGLILNLALSYGGRAEIVDAVRAIAAKVKDGTIDPQQITSNTISAHLQTADLPDPDLIIRTSGEFRISNFLLWQIAYAEIFVTNTLWPDFDRADMVEALENYLGRERRFGKVTEQLKTDDALPL